MAAIPAHTSEEVVVVKAASAHATTSTVTEWVRTAAGWHRHKGPLPAHNGYAGWSAHHREGDGTSPIGQYTLTAAGGRMPDPGATLPYDYRPSYYVIGGTFMGGDLAGAFDYVVAIDYNRVARAPPSDPRRPRGEEYGGGVWFHVDHDSPTHACISLKRPQMRALVRWLTPHDHPVVVMGPANWLSR